MCGRFTPIPRPAILEGIGRELGIVVDRERGPAPPEAGGGNMPSGQCLPFRDVDTLFMDRDGSILLAPMQWQLIHHWNREFRSDYTNFNTRYESLCKPHNRDLLRHHRCIVPVAEFFENRKAGGRTVKPKESWRFFLRGRDIIPLGGIYSIWTNPGDPDDRRYSCSVITLKPNELIGEIHNRMPFIVPRGKAREWLDVNVTDYDHLLGLIKPLDAAGMGREREERKP